MGNIPKCIKIIIIITINILANKWQSQRSSLGVLIQCSQSGT